jgi:hypothetical protein
MKELIEVKKTLPPNVIIDNSLSNYDDVVLFPKKLQEAREDLAKYGIPEKWANESLKNGDKFNFWTTGILSRVDTKENNFIFVSKTEDNLTENHYSISIIPDTLTSLAQDYLGKNIRIHIKPIVKKGQKWQYELIDLKAI